MSHAVAEEKSITPAGFDHVRFLADVFGLEPVAAYPVGSWDADCAELIDLLDEPAQRELVRIYDVADPRGENLSGQRRFLFGIREKIRSAPAFERLSAIIDAYEAETFCRFAAGVCTGCGRMAKASAGLAPICSGRRAAAPQRSARKAEAPVKQAASPIDKSEEFARQIASQLGQQFDPNKIGDFHYDFLLAGVPTFIWRFRDFEMEEEVLLDILERAEAAEIGQLYIAAYSHLVCRIPITVPGRIPYVVLPLAAEEETVPVLDYALAGDGVGKPN